MKGKKKDLEFLSEFISNCVENDKISSVEILNEAKSQIEIIDEKIKEVEKLKLIRSKLLDVVYAFEKEVDIKKVPDNYIFLNLKNKNICNFICDCLSYSNVDINDLYNSEYDRQELISCIKQLIEINIIIKNKDLLLKGINYDKYCKSVR